MSCDHQHDTIEAQTACDMAQLIKRSLGRACIVVVDGHPPGRDDLSDPAVSMIGNPTSVANMVLAILDMVDDAPKPTDCDLCRQNFTALVAARATLKAAKHSAGSC